MISHWRKDYNAKLLYPSFQEGRRKVFKRKGVVLLPNQDLLFLHRRDQGTKWKRHTFVGFLLWYFIV